MSYRTPASLLVVVALLLASCGGSADETASETAAPTTATPTSQATTTTAAPATTTAAPTTTTTAPTTTAAPTTTTTTATTTTTTTTTVPPLPDALSPTHGGEAVAVYLAVAEWDSVSGNPADGFTTEIAAAQDLGYFVGSGDLACDMGGQDGLGLPSDGYYWAASVLFATVPDANAFVAAYPGDVVGIVEVQTYCLD